MNLINGEPCWGLPIFFNLKKQSCSGAVVLLEHIRQYHLFSYENEI